MIWQFQKSLQILLNSLHHVNKDLDLKFHFVDILDTEMQIDFVRRPEETF